MRRRADRAERAVGHAPPAQRARRAGARPGRRCAGLPLRRERLGGGHRRGPHPARSRARLVRRAHPASRCLDARILRLYALKRDTKPLKIQPFSRGRAQTTSKPSRAGATRRSREALRWLKAFGDARMTGSGASVFAAFGRRARRARSQRGFPGRGAASRPRTGPASACSRIVAGRIGESPSWLRHRILIPAFEGSNPSSPATPWSRSRGRGDEGRQPQAGLRLLLFLRIAGRAGPWPSRT